MHPYNTAATSSATLNSILTTTASPRTQHQQHLPTIPAKRKIRDVSPTPAYDAYAPASSALPHPLPHPMLSPPPLPFPPIPTASTRRHRRNSNTHSNHSATPLPEPPDVSSEAIDCMCGFATDDGFSIACDVCSRWCHGACFGIAQGGHVPESFLCWVCRPRSSDERDTAVQLQRERLGGGLLGVSSIGLGLGLSLDGDVGKQRRRLSPGTDRRARKGHASTVVDGNGPAKRRRRPSVLHPPPTPTLPSSATALHPPPALIASQPADDEHVDIDAEPWTSTYVPITHDIVPDDDTRTKLRRHAQHWRGITAVSSSPPSPPPITIRPLPPSPSPLLASANPHCLPPAYAAYTTRPLPSSSLITPFLSCITPSSAYLREPTNGYAHLGMPKPYVHLVGPPLGVALDARGVGSEGRFVRWGCRPNAVLRPVLCKEGRENAQKAGVRYEKRKKKAKARERERDADETESEVEDDTTLGFAVFALRDLKAGEEVVLGWEWDDGHAVHRLPALLRTPNMLPRVPPGGDATPAELAHLRNQLSSILHALSSTFTTCACGARARDCALSAMAAVAERLEHLPHLDADAGFPAHDPGAWRWAAAGGGGVDEGRQARGRWADGVDLGPLVGRKRGFRTRERVPYSGGMGGMEMVEDEDAQGSADERRPQEENTNGNSREKGGSKQTGARVNGRRVLAGKYALDAGVEREQFTFSVVAPNGAAEPAAEEMLYVRQDRNGKGKARATGEEDVEMECVGGRSTNPPSGTASLHPDSASTPAARSSPVPTTHTQPNLEPRPPDPPPAALHDEDRMPPKMRKRWMHRAVKTRLQSEVSQLHAAVAATAGKETVVKDFDGWAVGADRGLAIRFDDQHDPTPPTPELADTHAQYLMPPPPMPAALDPTTISSQPAHSSSPTPSPPSPHLPTPSPTHPSLAPRVVHAESHGVLGKHPYHLHADVGGVDVHSTGTSPLNGFANLSLMSPALMLGEDKKAQLGESILVPSPSPSSPPPPPTTTTMTSADVVEMDQEHERDRQEAPLVDEDVEMDVIEDVQDIERIEVVEEEVQAETGQELSVPWSPLRRADKAEVVPELIPQVDDPKSEPALLPIIPGESTTTEMPLEIEEKSTPSPLDSMASTPAARVSPTPAPTAHLRDATPELDTKSMEEPQVNGILVRAPSNEPEAHTTPSEAHNPSPSPSPRPSSDPIDTNDTVDNADTQLPIIAKTLPPDHFFDTDDEEEWKRRMDVDDAPSAHASRSPAPRPVSDAQDDEDEDEEMEDTSRRPSISRETRSPEVASLKSEDEVDEPRERSPVPPKRRSSIDSSRSASITLDVEEATFDTEVDEPPPSTGTTVGSAEAPLSVESTASAFVLKNESPPPPDATASIAPDTASANPSAKSASPSPADSLASSAPDRQLSPASPNDALTHDHAAQPKVKLSLRDYMLRKKKQREVQEATKSAQASPMSVTSALAPEDGDGDGERGTTPIPVARSALKPLLGTNTMEGIRDPLSATPSSAEARSATLLVPSPAVSAPTPSIHLDANEGNVNHSPSTLNKPDTHISPLGSKTAGWYSQINKHDAVEQAIRESHASLTYEKPRSNAVTTLFDFSKLDTKVHDTIPIPSSLPTEVVAATPAKLDVHEPIINGYHQLPTKVPSPSLLPLPPKPPFLLPARPQGSSFVSPSPGLDTREAKKELLELPISHLSVSRPSVLKPPPQSNPPSQTTIHRLPVPFDRAISPISPDLNHSRRPSHEDGEIEASPPLAPYRPLATSVRPFPPKNRPFTTTNFVTPQSHSPPTGPRFLTSGPQTPTFGASGSTYRPPAPPLFAPTATGAAINRPAPPIAPRALRQSMLSNKPATVLPSNGASSTSYGGSQYIPRGPSADRDRDRDRDRDSRHYRGPRRGGGGAGWPR